MPSERHSPDALITQTGLTGAIGDIQDDPDSPDGNWLTTSNNTNTVCHTSFPSPSGNLTTGSGLQEFRAWVRKTNHSTDPTADLLVYENGILMTTLAGSVLVTSTTGQMLSGTWDASILSDVSGVNVELLVNGTVGGGSPGNRASVEVGAVEWNATYNEASTRNVSKLLLLGIG